MYVYLWLEKIRLSGPVSGSSFFPSAQNGSSGQQSRPERDQVLRPQPPLVHFGDDGLWKRVKKKKTVLHIQACWMGIKENVFLRNKKSGCMVYFGIALNSNMVVLSLNRSRPSCFNCSVDVIT